MRSVLTLTLAAAFSLGLANAAAACSWNKTASKDMTIAEVEKPAPEEAVTTFDPVTPDQLEEKVVVDED